MAFYDIVPGRRGGISCTRGLGVALVGQGGRLQNFALRGLGQDRIRVLVHDAPLRSLRRAGVSAEFLRPEWMQTSVVPRAESVAHGSGATGGIVESIVRSDLTSQLTLGYEHPNEALAIATTLAREDLALGVAYSEAADQHAADGTHLNTGYRDLSLLFDRRTSTRAHRSRTTLLASNAQDIGKSNSDFPERTTWYPRDRALFLSHAREHSGLGTGTVWLHLQELDTAVLENGEETRVHTETVDYGARFSARRPLEAGEVRWGLDLFGRSAYDVVEINAATIDDGSEVELGAHIEGTHAAGAWFLDWGGRVLHDVADANDAPSYQTTDVLGHVRAGWSSGNAGWHASVGRTTTLPSVSQLFFTGTTGRGSIVGNEDLGEETGWVYDLSVSGRMLGIDATIGAFYMDFDNFIEKVALGDDVDTFANTTGGEIRGVLATLGYSTDSFELIARLTALHGELDDGAPVRDLPNTEVGLLARLQIGKGTLTLDTGHRFSSDEVAPGNREADARTLLDVGYRLPLGERFTCQLFARNLLDELYYETNDEASALGPERSIGIGLALQL